MMVQTVAVRLLKQVSIDIVLLTCSKSPAVPKLKIAFPNLALVSLDRHQFAYISFFHY